MVMPDEPIELELTRHELQIVIDSMTRDINNRRNRLAWRIERGYVGEHSREAEDVRASVQRCIELRGDLIVTKAQARDDVA